MHGHEISDVQDLFSAATKTTYHTRSPCGVKRCIDVLNRLKSMSLSANDIHQFSKSIFQLETLRTHRSSKIREVSQSLLYSWLATLNGEGRDQYFKSDLTLEQKKKHVLTTCSKDEHRSLTSLEPTEEIKKKTGSVVELKTETEGDIKDKDDKVTTETLIPPPRRVAACKTEEMVELFEAAKKAADADNTKGILLGKADVSRCVEAISLLKKINVIPKANEPRMMMQRLEGLAKHKDRKICNAASAILQLWRQKIREQESKAASAIDMILYKPPVAHQICGQGFTRETTKMTNLVIEQRMSLVDPKGHESLY